MKTLVRGSGLITATEDYVAELVIQDERSWPKKAWTSTRAPNRLWTHGGTACCRGASIRIRNISFNY
jgi:hypothetical protein